MSKNYQGECLCGSIKVSMDGEPYGRMGCYCVDCRKGSGNISHIVAAYKTENVTVSDPEKLMLEFKTTNTGSGKPKYKNFCSRCGCCICLTLESTPDDIYVSVPILENGGDFVPDDWIFKNEAMKFTNGKAAKFGYTD